jgi:hypothetical protein
MFSPHATDPAPAAGSSRRQFVLGGVATLAVAGLGSCGNPPLACVPQPAGDGASGRPYPGRRTTETRSLTDTEARGWGPGWPADRSADMSHVVVPGTTRTISVHSTLAPIVDRCLHDTASLGYRLDEVDDEGGYVRRPMVTPSGRWTSTPSNHSWGTALDLNWLRNPMSTSQVITDIPPAVAELWEEWGFNWGGRWLTNGGALADAMLCLHFEYALSFDAAVHDSARLRA